MRIRSLLASDCPRLPCRELARACNSHPDTGLVPQGVVQVVLVVENDCPLRQVLASRVQFPCERRVPPSENMELPPL